MEFYHANLKKYRNRENLSCKRLSQMVGVGRTTFWKWETGSSIPSEGYVRLLAKKLNIPVTELSNLEPEQPVSNINYSETINSWLSFLDMDFEIIQQKNINEALQKILSLNKELLKATVIIRALLKATSSLMYVKDKDLKYMTANDSFLKNISLPSNYKVLNKTDADFFPQSEAKLNHDEDYNILVNAKPVFGVERHIPGSRKKKWGYVSKQPVFDNNKKISGIIGSFTDITKLKELEGKRLVLENAVNSIDAYVWIAKYNPLFDNEIQIFYINNSIIEKYKEITNKSVNEHYNLSLNKKICKEFNPKHYDCIKNLIKNPNTTFPIIREYREFSKYHNSERFFSEKVLSYEGNYFFGMIEDITDKKTTEKNLKLLDLSIDSMTDGVGIYDLEQDKYIYLNKAIENITGYPINKLYGEGRTFWLNNCVHPDDRLEQEGYFTSHSWPITREHRIVKPNGEQRWIEAKTFPRSKTPNAETVITIMHDITNERMLQKEHELLSIHIDGMPFGIIIMDSKTYEFIYVNKTIENIFGHDPTKFTGSTGFHFWLQNCVHPDDKIEQLEYFKTKQWPKHRRYRIIKPDGKTRIIEARTSKYSKYQNRECYIAIVSDVTEQIQKDDLLKLLEHSLSNSYDCLSIRCLKPYKLIYLSDSCKNIFGYTKEDFFKDITIRLNKCIHPDDRDKEAEYVNNKNYPPIRNYRIVTPDSMIKHIQESTFNITYNSIDYLCGITRDITNLIEHKSIINEREKEIIKLLKLNNVNLSTISKSTGFSIDDIEKICKR